MVVVAGVTLQLLDRLDPVKRRALTALMIRVAGAALAYGMQILLVQWMGLTEYGIFVAVWVWLLVLCGIAPPWPQCQRHRPSRHLS